MGFGILDKFITGYEPLNASQQKIKSLHFINETIVSLFQIQIFILPLTLDCATS